MLQEPRQSADGTWRWAPVFRPRVAGQRFTPRPAALGPVPFSAKRATMLVHLACNGYDGGVRFGRS